MQVADKLLLAEIDAAPAKAPGIKYLTLEDSPPRPSPKGFYTDRSPHMGAAVDLERTQQMECINFAIDDRDPMERTQRLDDEAKALRRMEARVQRVEFLTTEGE